MIEGKRVPMAQVHGFWSAAIRAGVKALAFSIDQTGDTVWMQARIDNTRRAPAIQRAAAAALAVDKEIALSSRTTPASQARTALMLRLMAKAPNTALAAYQDLLVVAVLQRVANDPARMLEALAQAGD